MFNDTFIILICKVFSCTKCGCFCKVDFSGLILFEMKLKVDEGREGRRVGGREGETFSVLHIFLKIILQPKLLYKRSYSYDA